MLVLISFVLISLLTCFSGDVLYTTPYGTVRNLPGIEVRRIAHEISSVVDLVSHHDRVKRRVENTVTRLDTLFGEDRVYGWGDIGCWIGSRHQYSWPFRSELCREFSDYLDVWSLLGILVVSISGVAFGVSYRLYLFRHRFVGNLYVSHYISWLMSWVRQPPLDCAHVRQTFTQTQRVRNPTVAPNHSHPFAARLRTDSSNTMRLVCSQLGMTPYMVQQSRSDQRKNLNGCRTYYWGKDIVGDVSGFAPERDDVICIVDVDMYLPMDDVLARHPATYLISTFQPSAAAYEGDEYAFTFNKNNEVEYRVTGGAKYVHQVWNYNSDIIVARSPLFMGLGWRITTYNVDRTAIDKHHSLICLTPMRTFISPLFRLDSLYAGDNLKRLSVSDGTYARLATFGPDGFKMSTAILGQYAVSDLPIRVDNSLTITSSLSSVNLTTGQVRTATGITDHASASVLTHYHRSAELESKYDICYPASESIQKYQFDLPTHDPEAKNALKAFMDPIVLGAFSPDSTKGNDEAAVRGRITDVKATEELEMTPFIQNCIDEFVGFLIPEEQKHKHYPVGLDEVYAKQNRPAQNRILRTAEVNVGDVDESTVETMQKGEAYASGNYPRIITTIPGINKLHYSSFIYSFTKCLRETKWYAFGKTPIEIAKRIAEICMTAIAWIIMTDFSKMDGRVSKLLRVLERVAMLRWFHPDCHARLVELMDSQKNRRARTKFGVKYDTGDARLSGSPETADFNSMDDAFIAYMGYRKQGYTAEQAWAKLGLFGGDDGCTADAEPAVFTGTAKSVGQVLEVEVAKRGEPGVSYLGRIYSPHVWEGDTDSMCDLFRQMSKFHTTVHLPSNVSAMNKLATKAFAYSLGDSNTPVVGDISRLITEHYPELITEQVVDPVKRSKIGTYFAYYPKDVQYPNSFGDWMYDVLYQQMPTFDLSKFRKWLCKAKTESSLLLHPPLCVDANSQESKPPPEPIVVNGVIVPPAIPPKPSGLGAKPVSQAEKAKDMKPQPGGPKGPCKYFLVGKCTYGKECRSIHEGVPVPQSSVSRNIIREMTPIVPAM